MASIYGGRGSQLQHATDWQSALVTDRWRGPPAARRSGGGPQGAPACDTVAVARSPVPNVLSGPVRQRGHHDRRSGPGTTPPATWPSGIRPSPRLGEVRQPPSHQRAAQARAACAAALLRWLHVVVTQRVAWDPAVAAGQRTLEPAA